MVLITCDRKINDNLLQFRFIISQRIVSVTVIEVILFLSNLLRNKRLITCMRIEVKELIKFVKLFT